VPSCSRTSSTCRLRADPRWRGGDSMAQRLRRVFHMDQPQARRCAIWVDTTTLMAAQELANCAGVDVDAFIEFVVKELHEHEARGLASSPRSGVRGRARHPDQRGAAATSRSVWLSCDRGQRLVGSDSARTSAAPARPWRRPFLHRAALGALQHEGDDPAPAAATVNQDHRAHVTTVHGRTRPRHRSPDTLLIAQEPRRPRLLPP
jgi:hypothetical protein